MQPLIPDTSFHIYNHANGFENVFRETENYRFFLEKYCLHISPVAETYAYCLMPNHFHLVVRIRKCEVIEELIRNKKESLATSTLPKFQTLEVFVASDDEIEKFLSKQFSNLFSSYTQSFNKVYNRMGSLFVKNFKREPIYNKPHFLSAVVYTHRNPIHHGFCKGFEDWAHSSYNSILYGAETFVEAEKLLKLTGVKEVFIELHKNNLERFESMNQFDIP